MSRGFYEDGSIDELRKSYWANEGLPIILVIMIILSMFMFGKDDIPFMFLVKKITVENVESLIWQYTLLIIAIERAAAVIVGNSRHQSNVDWSLRIKRLSETLSKDAPHLNVLQQLYNREVSVLEKLESKGVITKIKRVEEDNHSPVADDYVGFLLAAKHSYEFQQAKHNSITNRYIARAVFLMGIALACIGLSFFSEVVVNYEQISGVQKFFMRVIDILVTGGLLGGGSAGLSLVSKKIADSVNSRN